MVTENLKNVEERIQAACLRSGRKREDVTLIAVSKTKPVELLREAYDSGIIRDGVLVWYQGTVADITDYDIVLKDAESPALCGAEDTTVALELGKIQRLLVKEETERGEKDG